jgi:hypothetical protein
MTPVVPRDAGAICGIVDQSPSQFIREAILLRCAVPAARLTDQICRIAVDLRRE